MTGHRTTAPLPGTPRIGSLFSGTGGLDRGVQSVLGGTVAWHSEIDPGACKILAHRYPDVPNHGDITAVDWSAVEPVDVLTGGFPCTDVSLAGLRMGLTADTRSGLWTQMAYAIDQLHPPLVVIENVRGLLSVDAHHPAHSELESCPWEMGDGSGPTLRALGAVLGDLADIGFDAEWVGLRAADVGAPHGRFRVFVVAWPAADAVSGRRDGRTPDAVRFPFGRTTAPRGGEVAGGGAAAADADGLGHERGGRARDRRTGPADGGVFATDASGDRRDEGRTEPARQLGGSDDAALGCDAAPDPDGDGPEGVGRVHTLGRDADRRRGADRPGQDDEPSTREAELTPGACGCGAWGQYAPAVHRWEMVLGRLAPPPTELSTKGAHRLSARAVEFLMGLPAGWVTDVPGLGRNEMLKVLGNGVVPAQCAAALRLLLPATGVIPAEPEDGAA